MSWTRSPNEAGDHLFTYFDFPKSRCCSIKSTNVIESMFTAVKLRTDAARRISMTFADHRMMTKIYRG